MAEAQPLLELKDIDVHYGNIKVIHGESLYVNKSEVVALLGPNGAGKTTTVKTILGLVSLTNGSIFFAGTKINGLKPHKIISMGISVVPEGRGIFPKLTVFENLKAGSIFVSNDRQIFEEGLKFVYERFPILKERGNQIAGTLSGGEQTMLALARAMMSKPRLLLMDEPSLGLAPKLLDECFEIIREFNEKGTAVFLIEQNAAQALNVCRRAYILQKGKIVLEGYREKLLVDESIQRAYFYKD